jgi:hypothetical protein
MDEENVIQFEQGSFGGGTLAVAQYWSSGGNTYDCDIRFYSENDQGVIDWSSAAAGAPWGSFDVQYVAEHEIGHCLGLGHSSDSDSVMYAYANSGAGPVDRVLDADDLAGLRALYGEVTCLDLDGDGFTSESGCVNSGDCDDSDEAISPSAAEVCDDGVDNDCDGLADPSEDCPPDPPPPKTKTKTRTRTRTATATTATTSRGKTTLQVTRTAMATVAPTPRTALRSTPAATPEQRRVATGSTTTATGKSRSTN